MHHLDVITAGRVTDGGVGGILHQRAIGPSLEALAEGTRAVAQGDFTRQHPIQSSDELGALTGLFNQTHAAIGCQDGQRISTKPGRARQGYLEAC